MVGECKNNEYDKKISSCSDAYNNMYCICFCNANE